MLSGVYLKSGSGTLKTESHQRIHILEMNNVEIRTFLVRGWGWGVVHESEKLTMLRASVVFQRQGSAVD